MGGLRASTRVIAFVKIALLARILSPSEFGLFAIASLVLAFLEIVTETGINVFLIQEKERIENYLNTAWIVSIFRGILITLLLLISAPFISSFFKSEDSLNLLLLISLVPFIRGFINPALVKLQKELLFGKEFLFRFAIFSFDALVAITLSLTTGSAISLVWGLIAGVFLELILSYLLIKPYPKFVFEAVKAKRVISRGKWVTLAGIFDYLFREGDDIVVGRFLSVSSLGIYQMGYKISTLPITEVADVVIKVTFPVFVKISQERERLKRAFLKSLAAVSLIVIPFGIILFIFTQEIVLILLGEKWTEVEPILKVLAAFGVVRAITSTTYPLFLAVKKQQYVAILTLVGILGMTVSIIPLVRSYGVIGAGISALIGAIIVVPFAVFFTIKLFTKRKWEFQ